MVFRVALSCNAGAAAPAPQTINRHKSSTRQIPWRDQVGAQARIAASNLARAPGPRANGLMIGTSTPDWR